MQEDRPDELFVEENEAEQDIFEPVEKSSSKKVIGLLAFLLILISILAIVLTNITKAPVDFPVDKEFVIEKGTSLKEIIANAKSEGYIRSELALYLELRLKHNETPIKASTFVFNEPLTLAEFALKLTEGGKRTDLFKFTHIEGETTLQLANRADESLSSFDVDEFLALTQGKEGFLFPETYLIPTNFTAKELYDLLTTTFEEKMAELSPEIEASSLTVEEIIILASIIEREANSVESKHMVSGILQNRLDIGMALQVDASIGYVLEKSLSELTASDLEMDSPYNTYLYPGLTPTPISNPGLESIAAVLNPTPSDYLFYITGDDGNFYYAENFDQHRANIAKHLR